MTVNLTGVTNAQRTTLTLHNMKDVANQLLPDTTVTVGFLLGDTTGNGSVVSSDISQTKLQSGHPVTAANFRTDVNANGSINGTDVSLVKLNSGTGLP
jgi:dockerin type I repeat protein